jgi:guanylate kinase
VLINDVLDEAVTELRAIVEYERGEGGEAAAAMAQQLRTTVRSSRLEAVLRSFGLSVVLCGWFAVCILHCVR